LKDVVKRRLLAGGRMRWARALAHLHPDLRPRVQSVLLGLLSVGNTRRACKAPGSWPPSAA